MFVDDEQRPQKVNPGTVENYNPHRDCCAAGANFLRFRALALLGHLPSERVDGSAIQASEKPEQ